MTTTFNVQFIIRKQNKNSTLVNIYVRITVAGQRYELSAQRSCDRSKWNSQTGRLHGKTEDVKALNHYLDQIQARLYSIHQSFVIAGTGFTAIQIKNAYLGVQSEKPKLLLEIYREHNDELYKMVGNGFSILTFKQHRTVLSYLSAYITEAYKCDDLPISNLDYSFVHGFATFLKVQKNCGHNTMVNYIKRLKKIVYQCVSRGWLIKNPFVGFRMSVEETTPIILTKDELLTLQHLDISIDRLRLVRDIYLFSCFTGLAYCEVRALTSANLIIGVDGNRWISIVRSKTKVPSLIPLLRVAEEILGRYALHPLVQTSGKLLPVISNQRLNSYLKELADISGIKKELNFHSARHTFATTVTLSNGVPLVTVSKMLGHKTIRTTEHYARITAQKISADMQSIVDLYS